LNRGLLDLPRVGRLPLPALKDERRFI